MCGIAGIITGEGPRARLALRAMVAAQAHRGPDGAGEHYDTFGERTIGLGHRRLAIIDLSNQGAQPMIHPRTGDVLVYNGELYNFRQLRADLRARGVVFRGDSDSEVLLHALVEWGEAALARLEGMFAFAFYRKATQEMMLARDHLGIKPLYVARSGSTIAFASEVRALMACGLIPHAVDPRGIAGFMAYGACQHPYTMFEAVRSLPAGSVQTLAPGGLDAPPRPYWRPPAADPSTLPAAAPGRVRETIEAAIASHLVSDVPVGVFLSSGLDSTIVAGLAARKSAHLRSFTVGFAENPDLSELALAGATARSFGLDHTEIRIESADALAATRSWLSAIDLPSIDGLNVYVISEAVRARGITVALSGQGGDELFGGYSSFADVPRLQRALRYADGLPVGSRRQLARLAALGRPAAFRAKAQAIAQGGSDLLTLYTLRRRLMMPAEMTALGFDADALGLDPGYQAPAEMNALRRDGGDPVWRVGRFETQLYLGNMLLRDGDADGMAHSLEIRVPLLDRRVTELAFSLSGQTRLPDGRANKHLLRRAFPDLLRPDLLNQPKSGFTLPIRRWMLGPLREACEAGFDHLRMSGLVEPKALDAIWGRFVTEPESPAWSRAFACCVLGHYLREAVPAARQKAYAS